MTANQKSLLRLLLESDHYLVMTMNHNGTRKYKLFQGNANPVRWVHPRTANFLDNYFKKNKKGIITLNLNLVRQAHGKSNIKTYYKQSKNKNHGTGSNKS